MKMKPCAGVCRTGQLAFLITALTLVVLPFNLWAAFPAQFGPVTNFYAGGVYSGLNAIATGDFNGDGITDVAVANNSRVDLLLGRVGGAFSTSSTNIIYNGGNFLTAGDFNNDGKLDLLVVNDYGGAVLLGDGSGHFPAKTNCYANYPRGLAVGDFNGDGKLDLAITSSLGLTVAFGRGNGSFATPTTTNYSGFAGGRTAGFMSAGNLRGNGPVDLVVAMPHGGTDSFCVMQNNGDGTFAAPAFYVTTNVSDHYALTVSDFNSDGKPDVAVLNYINQSVSIWMNKGDGTFSLATNISVPGVSPASVASADFNGDGNMDLFVRGGSAARVLTGNGDGTFTVGALMNVPADSGASPYFYETVAVGDFTGRGMPDLALVNSPDTSVAIMLNQTPPILTLAPMANYCQITWLKTFGAGCALEYTTNISTPGNWQTFPYPPVVLGNQKAVTDWTDAAQKFYRLKKQ